MRSEKERGYIIQQEIEEEKKEIKKETVYVARPQKA